MTKQMFLMPGFLINLKKMYIYELEKNPFKAAKNKCKT